MEQDGSPFIPEYRPFSRLDGRVDVYEDESRSILRASSGYTGCLGARESKRANKSPNWSLSYIREPRIEVTSRSPPKESR